MHRFLCFCTLYLMQCFMHRWTHWCFPCFCIYCLIQCYMHNWTHWCFRCFIHIAWSSVTCSVGHNCVFRVLYTLFDAVLRALFDKLVFSMFFYILFDPVLHAPLDTLVFSLFYSYCLKQCYMHRWTQLSLPFFVHSILCRITCTVDQACVFLVFVHTVLSSVACTIGHIGVFRVFL